MLRMLFYAVIGLVVGFTVLFVLLTVTCEPIREEYAPFAVLALMGALPVASVSVLFGAVKLIQDELRQTRREMKSMKSSFHLTGETSDRPSSQNV